MPLKIRCPHCRHVLVAEDALAGRPLDCPECRQAFNVPLPAAAVEAAAPPPATRGRTCPRCGAEAAPTATWCRRCHRDLNTGRRLPLGRRLRLVAWYIWVLAGVGLVVLALAGAVAWRMHRLRGTVPPAGPVGAGAAERRVPVCELAEALLAARGPAELRAALERLRPVAGTAAGAVAAALEASLAAPAPGPRLRDSQRAAIDLLAQRGDASPADRAAWGAVLARCQQVEALRTAALRARAMLGEAEVLDELAAVWAERLRDRLLIDRVVTQMRREDDPGARLAVGRARQAVAYCGDGLQALARDESSTVFDRIAEYYWPSWTWLGQGPGDLLADEVFDLARPSGAGLEFRPEDVRHVRDVLKRVGQRATPAARAAAGLILARRGPQYRTVCRQIADGLAGLLPEAAPAEQQRLTWAIARLTGRLFGHTPRQHPLEVTAAEIGAALAWAHPGRTFTLAGGYPAPPALTYRAVTAERQLERALLGELARGWAAVERVADRWRAGGLGCTVALRERLSPGRRRPDYAALTCALIIVAEAGDQSVRPELELWHEAIDQPAWVRALAYTTLGSLDARSGQDASGWPAGLELGEAGLLDAGQPGWEHFGRIIAAGGSAAVRRLEDARAGALGPGVQARLLAAARRAQERFGPAGGP